MDNFPSEVLLAIFQSLNSKDMVKVMRCSKTWLEIIDENRSCWKRLILPSKSKGWNLSVVELFNRKSQSTLIEVSMNWSSWPVPALMETLQKSKDTLRILHIEDKHGTVAAHMDNHLSRFTKLIDCRVVENISGRTSLVHRGNKINIAQGLQILWIPHSLRLLRSEPRLFNRLVSLRLNGAISQKDCFYILERSSQTLKHVKFSMWDQGSGFIPPDLILPQLEMIDFQGRFPTWLKPPHTCTLLVFLIPDSLPSISRLWIYLFAAIVALSNSCPTLVELRIEEHKCLNCQQHHDLISMLRQRKANVEAGIRIDGVKMIPLKRLVLSSRMLSTTPQATLSQIRELVEEVVDLQSVSSIVQVEI